jgi:hypothetical protein
MIILVHQSHVFRGERLARSMIKGAKFIISIADTVITNTLIIAAQTIVTSGIPHDKLNENA